MKQKRKDKQKEPEEPEAVNSSFADFYELLDSLLPQSSSLLREALEKHKEALKRKSPTEQDETEALLEFEKEKNDCLLELLGIAIGQYQRVSADYANFQKRASKQISDTIAYEKEKIIKTLVPALDNFEHTLQNADSAENLDVLVKGIRIIYDQMLDILKSHGVEQIKALDEKFDPALHESMLQKAEPDKQNNLVLQEFQKGYKLNGRVIRPSRVIVNKLPTERPAEQKEQAEQEPEEKVDEQKQINIEDETTNTQ
jgi:molecular chaperone GrpE